MRQNTQLPEIGDLIDDGKYRIDRKIGEGAMGAVFAATHIVLRQQRAIKWLLPRLAVDENAVQRFLHEARIAATIKHPNVVGLFDVSTKTGAPFLVMELLDGEPLSDYLKDNRLAIEKAGRIIAPVLRGVTAAHAEGIIHRDLKPANVFLAKTTEGRTPKILDFGIAKSMEIGESQVSLTQEGSTLGTILYMSPEQMRDSKNVTVQTDVFALGMILYRILTGKLPYDDNLQDLVLQKHAGQAKSMHQHLAGIPEELDRAVMRALASKPEERYPDVPSFARGLAPFFPGEQLDVLQQNRISDLESHSDKDTTQPGYQRFECIGEQTSEQSAATSLTGSSLQSSPIAEREADESTRISVAPRTSSEDSLQKSDVDDLSTFTPVNIQHQSRMQRYRQYLFGMGILILVVASVVAAFKLSRSTEEIRTGDEKVISVPADAGSDSVSRFASGFPVDVRSSVDSDPSVDSSTSEGEWVSPPPIPDAGVNQRTPQRRHKRDAGKKRRGTGKTRIRDAGRNGKKDAGTKWDRLFKDGERKPNSDKNKWRIFLRDSG